MKRTLILILSVCFCFAASTAFARSCAASDRNLILTEGTGEVTGRNDSAKISIAVVTEARKLEQAGSENADKTRAVLAAVKGLNINHLKLKTSDYRVTPQRDYKARPPEIKGYEVSNAIEVTLEGFETEPLSKHVSRIVGKALESGANNIQRIGFYLKDRSALEKKALKLATKEAVERAKTLAEAAGVKLKGIVSLSTQPTYAPPRPHMLRAAEMKADAGTMAPPMEIGESRIRVQVSIAYEIAP
ncbi:MAG: SIMPL domain-containing protein [Deltaproteobacteria bacterium]|nr:SIMPL domain-containing protein [Deltaproteobacteria bacterium]